MMPTLKNAVPASLRIPVETSRYALNLMGRAQRPPLVAGAIARAAALSKSRFSRLPQEPEDARLTGVTRSLHRRLLALNIGGTLTRHAILPKARIA